MIVYFDTSAFVKLFLADEPHELARLAWDTAPSTAVSLGLYPEARAALAHARRQGRDVQVPREATGDTIDAHLEGAHVVTPTYRLMHEAGDLAESRALRGFDAVHLASALQNGPETVVVTADRRLADAARAEGMVVLFAV